MDWKSFFDRLGMDGTWWQWRLLRWQNRVASWFSATGDAGRVVAYRHKFCAACGALVDRSDRVCPQCGAHAPSWAGDALRRALRLILPAAFPASAALMALNLINLAVVALAFGLDQVLNPSSLMLLKMGALDPDAFLRGEYWRIVTYGFLHIGLLHIGFNMMALSQVGPALEREVGSARFLAVYLLSLLGGGALDILVRGPTVMVIAGASGALFGLIGFGMSYGHFYGGAAGHAQRNFFLQWALYGFVFGFVVRADNICHLGGFVTGAVLGYIVERERARRAALTPFWRGLASALSALVLLAFVWMLWAG